MYIKINSLKFVETCFASPEQYDVYDSNEELVGYVRLRYGHLTAEYPDCGGQLVYEEYFEDGWKGNFCGTDERMKYLEIIANKIIEKITLKTEE